MDQELIRPVDPEVARPKPASVLTQEERDARDQQHAETIRMTREFEQAQDRYAPVADEKKILVHFVNDGLTWAGKVWYRGQELEIGPSDPRWQSALRWITLDKVGQMNRYGKLMFEPGPWPYGTSYLDETGHVPLRSGKEKDSAKFAGPGQDALARAAEEERRRARRAPAPSTF